VSRRVVIFHAPEDAAAARACQVHFAVMRRAMGLDVSTISTESPASALGADLLVPLLSAPLAAWWVEAGAAAPTAARLVPVNLSACELPADLAPLVMVPKSGSVDTAEHKDVAWAEVAREVSRILSGRVPS
jgi:hypothetical protein